jgi:hypothetical protein
VHRGPLSGEQRGRGRQRPARRAHRVPERGALPGQRVQARRGAFRAAVAAQGVAAERVQENDDDRLARRLGRAPRQAERL